MASAEVATLKEELRKRAELLANANERAARAEGQLAASRETVEVLRQSLADMRDAMRDIGLAKELGEARARLDQYVTRVTTPQPVVRVAGDGRG